MSGVSAFGTHTGTSSEQTIGVTTGLAPRFVMTKPMSHNASWYAFDSFRTFASRINEQHLRADLSNSEYDNYSDCIQPRKLIQDLQMHLLLVQ